jgi:threonine/homoserine/homoserine lactone efflux protein
MAYLSFAGAVALLIASPGPIVALVVADARRGWPIWTIAGGVIAALLLLLSALATIHLTLDIKPAVLNWGQVVGGIYLVWLGLETLRETPEAEAAETGQAAGFWRAMGVGLSNPKDILFFLAFLPGFLVPSEPFMDQALALILIWGVIDISVMVLYSGLARRMHVLSGGQRLLSWAPGCFLLVLGLLSFGLGVGRIAR